MRRHMRWKTARVPAEQRKARIAAEASNDLIGPVEGTQGTKNAITAPKTDSSITGQVIGMEAFTAMAKSRTAAIGQDKGKKEVGSPLDVDVLSGSIARNLALLDKSIENAIKSVNKKDKYTTKDVSLLVGAQSNMIERIKDLSSIKRNVSVIHNSDQLSAEIGELCAFFKGKINSVKLTNALNNKDNDIIDLASTSHNDQYVNYDKANEISTNENQYKNMVNSGTPVNLTTYDNVADCENPPGSLFRPTGLLNDDPSLTVLSSSTGTVG